MGKNILQGTGIKALGGVSAGLYRKAPWHGVGDITDSKGIVIGTKRQLADDIRSRESIKVLASLDWEPREVMLADLMPNLVSDRKMLVRNNFPTYGTTFDLGVHSGKYGVISNDTGLAFVEEILKHRSDAVLQSVTTLYGGRIAFAVIAFHDNVQVTRGNGEKLDKHSRYMGVYWSHDGSYPLGVKYMDHEWVCENTFTPWNAETGLSVRHTVNAEMIAATALRAIEGMMVSFDAFDLEVQRLIETEVSRSEARGLTRMVIGDRPQPKENGKGNLVDTEGKNWDKRFEAIMSEWRDYTTAESAFDFVMAVQGYEQHRQPVRGGGRDVKTITRLLRDDFPMTRDAASLFTVPA